MSRAEEFLDLYRKLEAVAASSYGEFREGGAVAKLGKRAEFRGIREELDYIRDVRNLLSHRPKIADCYMVEPSEAMVDLLKKVIDRIERPAIAGNIMVKTDRVLSCSRDDLVLPVLKQMYDKAFSHIPVLDDGRVCGVFSSSVFIRCMTSGIQIDEHTTIKEIEKELALDSNNAEQFLFTGRETPIDELSELFEKAENAGRRLGMIFVTEHGRASERMTGIITAWDVAAAY